MYFNVLSFLKWFYSLYIYF